MISQQVVSSLSAKLWCLRNLIITFEPLSLLCAWSELLPVLLHFGSSASSSFQRCSHFVSDLFPVWTADDHCKANIEDNAGESHSQPKSSNAHFSIKAETKCKWETQNNVTEHRIEKSEHLSSEASNNS
jgi:hypothetical protein